MATCANIRTAPYQRDSRYRVLLQDVWITVKNQTIVVPRGFVWDGASIPPSVQGIMGHPFECQYMRGGLLHDYLYTTHKSSRAWADDAFYRLICADGLSSVKAGLVYYAVRWFAGSHWDLPLQGVQPEHKIMSERELLALEQSTSAKN